MSDNLVIAIIVGIFLLCVFTCIIVSCLVKQTSDKQRPKIRYDVVEPETCESV